VSLSYNFFDFGCTSICTGIYLATVLPAVCMFIKLSKFPQVDLNFLRPPRTFVCVCVCWYFPKIQKRNVPLLVRCPLVLLRTIMQVSLLVSLLVFLFFRPTSRIRYICAQTSLLLLHTSTEKRKYRTMYCCYFTGVPFIVENAKKCTQLLKSEPLQRLHSCICPYFLKVLFGSSVPARLDIR